MDFDFLKRAVRGFFQRNNDSCINAFSAQAAFFVILAFFPFLMALLILIQYLPVSENDINNLLSGVLPATLAEYIRDIIGEIFKKSTPTLFSLTIITTVWSAGKGMFAVIKGLNVVYDIEETRNYFKLRGMSAVYTCAFIAILALTILFLGFGNRIVDLIVSKFPHTNDFAYFIMSLRSAVSLCLLICFFIALFTIVPNRKSSVKDEIPGAVVSACGWIWFTYIYELYIDRVGSYSYLFGSLTAILLLMLWLYTCMYILFIGAQINAFIKNDELGKEFKSMLDTPVKIKKTYRKK